MAGWEVAGIRRGGHALAAGLLLASLVGRTAPVAAGLPPAIPDPAPFHQPADLSWQNEPVPVYPDATAAPPAGLRADARSGARLLFPWYDNIGLRTWIHLVNPTAGTRTVTLRLAGVQVAQVGIEPGRNRYLSLAGKSGGPLLVEADGPVVASERTGTGASFSEFFGLDAGAAASDLAFNWYDSLSLRTWILAVNPGTEAAHAVFKVGDAVAWSPTIAPGAVEAHLVAGLSNGPALLSSDRPLLASERSMLGASFFETAGRSTAGLPTEAWYAWYDSVSGLNDLHLANLGPAGSDASVFIDQLRVWSGSLGPHQHTVVSIRQTLGGPIRVVSTAPLLSSLRGIHRGRAQAIQEYPLVAAAAASTSHWAPWYDYVTPGAYEDVHLVAPSAGAHATISVAGKTVWAGTIDAGRDRHVALPGIAGGPVFVTSDEPLLSWQRAVYDPIPPPPPPPTYSIVLTVDDCGPPAQMREIIQTIADKHIPAMFFPTGLCKDLNPWLVPEIKSHGYAACNHTYSHVPLTNLTYQGLWNEIATGVHAGCNLLRPPYGAWDGPRGRVAQVAAAQGFRIFLWDIDTGDSVGTSADFMLGKIRGRSGVVLMHFQGAHTLEAIRAL